MGLVSEEGDDEEEDIFDGTVDGSVEMLEDAAEEVDETLKTPRGNVAMRALETILDVMLGSLHSNCWKVS